VFVIVNGTFALGPGPTLPKSCIAGEIASVVAAAASPRRSISWVS